MFFSFDKTFVQLDYFQVARVFFPFSFFNDFFLLISVSRICKLYNLKQNYRLDINIIYIYIYWKWNCVSRNNSILNCLLITFSDHQKKTPLPVPTLLANSNFFRCVVLHPSLIFPLITIPCKFPLEQNWLSLTVFPKIVIEKKRDKFWGF